MKRKSNIKRYKLNAEAYRCDFCFVYLIKCDGGSRIIVMLKLMLVVASIWKLLEHNQIQCHEFEHIVTAKMQLSIQTIWAKKFTIEMFFHGLRKKKKTGVCERVIENKFSIENCKSISCFFQSTLLARI